MRADTHHKFYTKIGHLVGEMAKQNQPARLSCKLYLEQSAPHKHHYDKSEEFDEYLHWEGPSKVSDPSLDRKGHPL